MRILVSGSHGFVGSALVQYLAGRGHDILPLVRSTSSGRGVFWDPEKGEIDTGKIEGIDAAVHLAGENIAGGRWTAARKSRLLESRVKGTTLLSNTLATLSKPPRAFVSASATGYYGNRGAEVLREDSRPGRGFLADLCQQWESSTEPAKRQAIRVVPLRIGIVLGSGGGVLGKMLLPFKLGVGGKIGSGSQYMSWIALEDLCAAILHAIQSTQLHGPVNAVAPNAVTNLEFTRTLAGVLRRPAIFPLPAFAARLALGEMADELLLTSARAEPGQLLKSGFNFKYPDLEPALRSVLKN